MEWSWYASVAGRWDAVLGVGWGKCWPRRIVGSGDPSGSEAWVGPGRWAPAARAVPLRSADGSRSTPAPRVPNLSASRRVKCLVVIGLLLGLLSLSSWHLVHPWPSPTPSQDRRYVRPVLSRRTW